MNSPYRLDPPIFKSGRSIGLACFNKRLVWYIPHWSIYITTKGILTTAVKIVLCLNSSSSFGLTSIARLEYSDAYGGLRLRKVELPILPYT